MAFDILTAKPVADPGKYGFRYGTSTPKAEGYFGELPTATLGDVATEYSFGGSAGEMPSITPALSPDQVRQVVEAAGSHTQPPNAILDKSEAHAKERAAVGQDPFWRLPEVQHAAPAPYPTAAEQAAAMIDPSTLRPDPSVRKAYFDINTARPVK